MVCIPKHSWDCKLIDLKKTITVNCFSFGLMLCSFLVDEVLRQEEYCESCIAFRINQCQYIYFLVTQS